ncbi:unnamed protein product [Acanthoscelides obtectus]|uniref:Uncharacterized protein n=1 Tax=Acanthoscelides obtectus TaxID=200917 RepID=A0A9P0KIC0_ACAOB|nr:unnamed protein product [Acanthoscelides obtectus]CAK1635550.1 hypothetical protein AOBTE_LOCUS9348 [Acanthoscelides obtectus]
MGLCIRLWIFGFQKHDYIVIDDSRIHDKDIRYLKKMIQDRILVPNRKMIAKLLLFTVGLLYVEAQIQNSCELIEWTGGHFDWPNEATKSIYRSSGRYIPRNVIATRAQIYRD